MTVKSLKKVSKQTKKDKLIANLPVRKRGRPKGSKNKPKIATPSVVEVAVAYSKRGRGRPKGSKNKPKDERKPVVVKGKRGRPKKQPTASPVIPVEAVKPAIITEEAHPLVAAVKWLEKYMHPIELQHYRSRANRLEAPLRVVMALDILSIFNVQDADLKKQIKKSLA